jgi:two-component system, NtrC family, response regulator GlrR
MSPGPGGHSAGLIGESPAHVELLKRLDKVAPTDAEVLISGPTGAGKELYAGYVHEQSRRRASAFVPVNCGGLPVELIENELFGHVGGAFTGARAQSAGLISAAEGGTIFLDEVDSLPLACQAKLLRFLQQKEYRRLGETRLRHADLRIIAATNADLIAAVRAKSFREDFFFRLRVVPIEVPSLAQRREDIPLLLKVFSARIADEYRLPQIVISDRACERLLSYAWPGNVRELENCVKYLTCLQLTRPVDPYDLPLIQSEEANKASLGMEKLVDAGPLKTVKRDLVTQFERAYLEHALQRYGGNITAAARASGKPRRAFFELMRKHGITTSERSGQKRGDAEPDMAAADAIIDAAE